MNYQITMNLRQFSILFSMLLLVPIVAYAQSTVNDDFTTTDDNLFGLIPDDNTVGPVGIVSELYKAHSDVTGIMVDHSKGNFSVAESIVFTMVLVDEENQKLVVMLDPILLSLGLETDTSDIQKLFGNDDVSVDLSYAVFIPESHVNPSSQSQIDAWISLYNDRCSVSTTSGLCQALIFNLQTQNHYTLNSSGIWVAPSSTSTSTPTPEPSALTPTSTTPNSTSNITLFLDDFEDGTLNKWTESDEPDWRADAFGENRVPPSHSNTNKVAEADNCDTMCTLTIKNVVDISSATNPKLEFWRYIDRSLDNTEYLKVEVTKNGIAWIQLDKWNPENRDDDDTWHKETYDLSSYKSSNFKVRFVASMSSGSEDVGIDDVKITSSMSSTTSTVKKFYGGQQIIMSQSTSESRRNMGVDPQLDDGTITIGVTKTNGQLGFVTAGHVVKISDSSTRDPVTLEGYYLSEIKRNVKTITNDQLRDLTLKLETKNPTIRSDFGGNGDMAFVPLESTVSVSSTKIIKHDGTFVTVQHGVSDDVPLRSDIEIVGINNNAVGTLSFKNATAINSYERVTFTDMAVGHYSSIPGDSGAPILFDDGSVTKIIGVHQGSVCKFKSTDTGEILRDYNNNRLLCPSDDSRQPYYKLFTTWENIKSNLNLR